MKKITIILFTVIMAAGIIFISGCNKNYHNKEMATPTVSNNLDDNSQALTAHILAFKTKMEYYKDHPGLKNADSLYTADSAVLEIEALLNFNFCYTDIECNKKKFATTYVTMPLDNTGKIDESNLAQVYDEIIDSIQARMLDVNYPDLKLLLVDLEQTGTDENGNATVSIGALVGNEIAISNTNEQGWWFGKEAGNCQGEHVGWDATDQIMQNINFVHFPAPPPGKIRRKTDIIILPVYMPEDYFLVSYEDRDNFEDSRLFYAVEDNNHNPPLHITDDTRCVSSDEEEMFYTNSYNLFITNAEDSLNLDLTECVVNWYELFEGNPQTQTKIWHTLTITLGHVWLVDEGSVSIEDILAY